MNGHQEEWTEMLKKDYEVREPKGGGVIGEAAGGRVGRSHIIKTVKEQI